MTTVIGQVFAVILGYAAIWTAGYLLLSWRGAWIALLIALGVKLVGRPTDA